MNIYIYIMFFFVVFRLTESNPIHVAQLTGGPIVQPDFFDLYLDYGRVIVSDL